MQKHYVAWGDWCSDIRTLQDAEEIVAAYAASEVDPEIERLKHEAGLIALDVDEAEGRIARLKAESDLIKAALRWCLEFVNFTPMADGSYLDCNSGDRITPPPQFAAVIADAIDQATKGPTNV